MVKACLRGKRRAQEELYQRFSVMVFRTCLRYSIDEDEANDLLQETFIKAFSKLNHFKGEGALGGWLRRVAVNICLEKIRKKNAVRKLEIVYEEEDAQFSGSDEIFHNMDLEVLLAKIQALPVGFRTVFNLYAVDGYTHVQIAQELNISEGTSKSQYSRARVLLMKMIREEEEEIKKRLSYGE